LRNEQFAHAVERGRTLPLVFRLFGTTPQLLPARILFKDGHEVELRLGEVDLDQDQLVCADPYDAPVHIPLAQIEAVWHRRPLVWRSASVWIGGTVLGALAGGLVGALFGISVGAMVARALDDSPSMYQWTRLYDQGAA